MEYLSKERYDELVAELQQLIKIELPKAKDELTEARAKGDLSENFEYHAAKRALRRVMSKIKFQSTVLQNAQVLDTSKRDMSKALLLSKVTMQNLNTGATMTYTLVSPHEANLSEGKVSVKSPIGQALLNKQVGDTVQVRVPAGLLNLKITNLEL